MRDTIIAFAIVMISSALATAGAQCGLPGTQGTPEIGFEETLLGRNTEFFVSKGSPGADWICLADSTPGPTPTPFGSLCVGPNPVIAFSSYRGDVLPLDAAGEMRVAVSVPPSLGPVGALPIPLHFQVLLTDPTTASGISASDGASVTFKSPRVFATTETSPTDSVVSINPVTGHIDFQVSTPYSKIYEILHAPRANALAVLTHGEVFVFDQDDGTLRFSTPIDATAPIARDIALTPDGHSLLMLSPADDFSINYGTAHLKRIDLFSGAAVGFSFSHLNATGLTMFVHPTQDVVYLPNMQGLIYRMNYMTGVELPLILTGLPQQPFYATTPGWNGVSDGQSLWLISTGNGIGAGTAPPHLLRIDLATDTVTASNTLTIGHAPAEYVVLAENGPMSSATPGPALFVHTWQGTLDIDPTTLSPRRNIAAGGRMALSNGGTELLSAAYHVLLRYDLEFGVLSVVSPTTFAQHHSDFAVTEEGAYFIADGDLHLLATDPATPPVSVATVVTPTPTFSLRIVAE